MTITEIGSWGVFLIVAIGGWYRAMEARERANAAVAGACRRAGLQLLDGTVAMSGLRLVRVPGSGFAVERSYNFDYSTDGYARRQGFVILVRGQVQTLGLAPGDGTAADGPGREGIEAELPENCSPGCGPRYGSSCGSGGCGH